MKLPATPEQAWTPQGAIFAHGDRTIAEELVAELEAEAYQFYLSLGETSGERAHALKLHVQKKIQEIADAGAP